MDMSEEDYAYITLPAPNDPMLELIHLLADLSILSKASGSICASQGKACQNLLLGCISQMERHNTWYSRWEERIGGSPSVYAPGKYTLKSLLGFDIALEPNLNTSLTDDIFQVN